VVDKINFDLNNKSLEKSLIVNKWRCRYWTRKQKERWSNYSYRYYL